MTVMTHHGSFASNWCRERDAAPGESPRPRVVLGVMVERLFRDNSADVVRHMVSRDRARTPDLDPAVPLRRVLH